MQGIQRQEVYIGNKVELAALFLVIRLVNGGANRIAQLIFVIPILTFRQLEETVVDELISVFFDCKSGDTRQKGNTKVL